MYFPDPPLQLLSVFMGVDNEGTGEWAGAFVPSTFASFGERFDQGKSGPGVLIPSEIFAPLGFGSMSDKALHTELALLNQAPDQNSLRHLSLDSLHQAGVVTIDWAPGSSLKGINLSRSCVSQMVLPKRPIIPIDTAPAARPASLPSAIEDNLNGLYRFALRLTRNTDDAQELTQETVARAWERQNAISRNTRAWLFQTLYHTFISDRRRQGRWRKSEIELDEEGAKHAEGPTELLPSIIVKEDVRRAIEILPDELRVVVWLSDAEELPLREIAQVVGCPVGTVASRLWRARQELRKLLAAYGQAEGQQ